LSQRAKAEALLVVVTMIWGSTFVIVKGALGDASPLPFISARFILAGGLLFAIFRPRAITRPALAAAAMLGLWLFAGYVFQTAGLQYTTPSKSAFITGFSVILVPLITWLRGAPLRLAGAAGAALGLAGLYFLFAPSGAAAVNRGDWMTLAGAMAFGIYIVLVEGYTRRFPIAHLVPPHILLCGLLATACLPFDREARFHPSLPLAAAVAVTAVFATAIAFTGQNWAQRFTPAAHTALIFALEPLFAALTSRWVLGERLTGKVMLGAVLILAGMVISEIWAGGQPSAVES
jgi:drug/metabolite transporter (DMT)-like permease